MLIGAAFEQDVSLAFIDDGVFQLMDGQDTAGVGMKNFSTTYKALGDYEVRKLYVERESLDERGLTLDDLHADHLRGRERGLRRKALDPPRRAAPKWRASSPSKTSS